MCLGGFCIFLFAIVKNFFRRIVRGIKKMCIFAENIKKRIMAEKKYSLSLEQLNELVSDAVATAIKKLDYVEIMDDDSAEDEQDRPKGNADVKVSQMDEQQYREAMDTMAKNRGAGDEPKG